MKSVLSNIHFAKADLNQDKKAVITYTANRWSLQQIKWILSNFDKDDLIDAVNNPLRWEWDKKSYNFFAKLLWIRVDKNVEKYAIKTLNPVF